jgi:hypothetical protein
LVLRPKPRNRYSDFEAQITKLELPVLRPKPRNPPPPWFWGSTKKPTFDFEAKPRETIATSFEAKLEKTVATGFEAKPKKTVTASFEAKPLETVVAGFEAKPQETVVAGFEANPLETVTTGFEAKPVKTIWVVLWPNHSQTVAIGFEAQTDEKPSLWFWGQTTDKPSTLVLRINQETRAPRPHVHSADRTRRYPTSRSPGHWVPDLCDHLRSSAPGHLFLSRYSSLHAMPHLPPTHHETSKCGSPNETKVKEKQNKIIPDSNSNLARSMTHHNQTKEQTTWFLTHREALTTMTIVDHISIIVAITCSVLHCALAYSVLPCAIDLFS